MHVKCSLFRKWRVYSSQRSSIGSWLLRPLHCDKKSGAAMAALAATLPSQLALKIAIPHNSTPFKTPFNVFSTLELLTTGRNVHT